MPNRSDNQNDAQVDPDQFEAAADVLRKAVSGGAFPAVTAEVGASSGVLWRWAWGTLSGESGSPPTTAETIFDLASLTKPLVTTTVCMTLVERGVLGLDDPVGTWLPAWNGPDRSAVTIADLLQHSAGLSAHLPLYRHHTGRQAFESAICSAPLEYAPRTRAVYSDLGFMLLGFIVENAARQTLEGLFHRVVATFGASDLHFRPPAEFRQRIAPTGFDAWRGRVLVGEVHDRNAWALGGVAGHAGLFGTAAGVGTFARAFLRALRGGPDLSIDPALVRRFCVGSAVPSSSRALGWDTMRPTSSCGTLMSAAAVGHTGYTGTSLWIDSERDAFIVLLTNRVHPTDDSQEIRKVRPQFHDAVMGALRGQTPEGP